MVRFIRFLLAGPDQFWAGICATKTAIDVRFRTRPASMRWIDGILCQSTGNIVSHRDICVTASRAGCGDGRMLYALESVHVADGARPDRGCCCWCQTASASAYIAPSDEAAATMTRQTNIGNRRLAIEQPMFGEGASCRTAASKPSNDIIVARRPCGHCQAAGTSRRGAFVRSPARGRVCF